MSDSSFLSAAELPDNEPWDIDYAHEEARRLRVYISGPISLGDSLSREAVEANLGKFPAAARALSERGYKPVDPTHNAQQDGLVWLDYMRRDIHALVECDGIAMLDGWEKSRGACVEEQLARALGFRVASLDEWLSA